ncbi:triphosphoribosyl-dephospho-CoA synthase CitG [Ammoniphilus sp. 3BR4]|uniref:triphosphoribosyl-dephospho-CoA synthase CitG n=1 Tax=Ammoniphilus sp. 3BR4 TaxID=3158265 RepID=UPI0034664555
MQTFQYSYVKIEDILEAKEKRTQIQRELRSLYYSPVVSISVNMPGKVKYTNDTVDLIYSALVKMREYARKAGCTLLEERIFHAPTGPVAMIAMKGDAHVIKGLAMSIEEEHSYSRLLDIDVFDQEGRQINRANQGLKERACMVCSQPAVMCIRSQSHTPEEVLSMAMGYMNKFKAEQTNIWPAPVIMIGNLALEAILMEATCSPAPGLVDRFHSGAHEDMDFFTFITSSSAINVAMYRCAMAGWMHKGEPRDLLNVLRPIGREAEASMFKATKGVNTHKGMIFLVGILSAAASLAIRKHVATLTSQTVIAEVMALCDGIVERELASLQKKHPERDLTAGERYYLEYGVTGIRGEMEDGLQSVQAKGLPRLREALSEGLSVNDALIHALIGIMTASQDTTILNRHDMDTLYRVQAEAASIMADGGMLTPLGRRRVKELDETYSRSGISPGGAADLLAATYFLHRIEEDSLSWSIQTT